MSADLIPPEGVFTLIFPLLQSERQRQAKLWVTVSGSLHPLRAKLRNRLCFVTTARDHDAFHARQGEQYGLPVARLIRVLDYGKEGIGQSPFGEAQSVRCLLFSGLAPQPRQPAVEIIKTSEVRRYPFGYTKTPQRNRKVRCQVVALQVAVTREFAYALADSQRTHGADHRPAISGSTPPCCRTPFSEHLAQFAEQHGVRP